MRDTDAVIVCDEGAALALRARPWPVQHDSAMELGPLRDLNRRGPLGHSILSERTYKLV